MTDEFGRTLEEQLRDAIQWEYFLAEHAHAVKEEYRSDVSHQDGDLPYRMQMSSVDDGLRYCVNDYFPHFHYQTGYVLADESYELLTGYWRMENLTLESLELEAEAIDRLAQDGAVDDLSDLEIDTS